MAATNKFFALEGLDGCGKSSILKELKKIHGDKLEIVSLYDGGDVEVAFNHARNLVADDTSVTMAMLSAFTLLLNRHIKPKLEAGKIVVEIGRASCRERVCMFV